jgi:2Fe-2S ferredoxin
VLLSGRNPYIAEGQVRLPTRPFRITFIDSHKHEHVVEVDPASFPYARYGEPGSVLSIALGSGIEVDHACGGVCACATCHVVVRQGYDACNPPTDAEEDQLDDAYGLTTQSRLACQCIPTGEQDLVVEIPSWNRNEVREGR